MSEFWLGSRASGSPEGSFWRESRRRYAPASPVDFGGELPFELAAVRHLVDPALLRAAAKRSAALDVGGDEILRAHDILSADEMARSLADALDLPFDPLEDEAPAAAPVLEAMQAGILARRVSSRATAFTIAPHGKQIRELARVIQRDPAFKDVLRFTSPERMAAYVQRAGPDEVAHYASTNLRDWRPDLSAASRGRYGLRKLALLTAGFAAIGGYFFPHEMLIAAELILCTAFLAWIGLRLHACQMRQATVPKLDIPDRALPNYSVVVALYREARVAAQLAGALKRIDYPVLGSKLT